MQRYLSLWPVKYYFVLFGVLCCFKQGNKWKSAFNTRTGHYEYQGMLFGLCNATVIFQKFNNNVFYKMLKQCAVNGLHGITAPGHQTCVATFTWKWAFLAAWEAWMSLVRGYLLRLLLKGSPWTLRRFWQFCIGLVPVNLTLFNIFLGLAIIGNRFGNFDKTSLSFD